MTFGDDIVVRRRVRPAQQTRVVRRLRSTASVPGCPRPVDVLGLADKGPAEVSRAMPGDPSVPGTSRSCLSGDPQLDKGENPQRVHPRIPAAMDPTQVRAWVEVSCAMQGLRPKVDDDAVIRQVVTLLTCGATARQAVEAPHREMGGDRR
jgi:hypothetical protein